MKIRKELQSIVDQEDKLGHSSTNFRFYRESFNLRFDIEKKIIKMIKTHNILLATVDLTNTRFGFSMLFLVFSSFFSFLYCGYNLFIEVETRQSSSEIIGEDILIFEYQFLLKTSFFSESICIFSSFLVALISIVITGQSCVNEVEKRTKHFDFYLRYLFSVSTSWSSASFSR